MSSSKSSKGTTSQKKEDRELHETFCNGSPGCPFPECAEGTVLEEEDRDAICDECGAPKNSEVCQECIDLKKYGEYPFEEEDDYCENCFAKSLDDCICREGDPE